MAGDPQTPVHQASSRKASWRFSGRVLCALGLAAIGAAQAAGGAGGERSTSLDGRTLALLGAIGAVYGAGAKLADLTAEHGLRSRLVRWIAYGMTVLGLLALTPFAAGATMIASEVAFHGVIKGKADNRGHLAAGVLVLPLVVAAFAWLPTGRVDWTTVAILLGCSQLWMGLNNRWLRLGDNLFHQVRGDVIATFGVLSLIDPPRWLPFAVVVATEHIAYALTKRIAMRARWYRRGDDAAPGDSDPFGAAFHAQDPRA